MGYGDIGPYGGTEIRPPTLNKLAYRRPKKLEELRKALAMWEADLAR